MVERVPPRRTTCPAWTRRCCPRTPLGQAALPPAARRLRRPGGAGRRRRRLGLLTLVAGPLGPIAGAAARRGDRGPPGRRPPSTGACPTATCVTWGATCSRTSALVALVHPVAVNALVEGLQPLGQAPPRQSPTDEMVAKLTATR